MPITALCVLAYPALHWNPYPDSGGSGPRCKGSELLQFGIAEPVLRSEHQSMDGWIVMEETTVGAIGIRLLAGSALRALKGVGASERTLKVYECTGFGELCRRFEARGATEYSPELADVVVREVWADFERGALSSWKWTAVRRGAALLDAFDRTGSVDLPPLPPWSGLRLPPMPGQLADPGNLHALVWAAQQRLRELGVSAKTLQHYRYDGFDPIVRAHQEQGLTRYSAAVTAGLVDRSRALLEQKAMRPSVWRDVRKCAAVLDELSRTGGLQRRLLPHWGLRNPGEAFDAALGEFCVEVAQDGLHPAQIPFDLLDAVFLGGSTSWKLGPAAADLATHARQHHKWVHMGRVNSLRRMCHAATIRLRLR